MNTENKNSQSGQNIFFQFRKAIGIGLVTLAALGAVVYLYVTSDKGDTEVVELASGTQPGASLNVGQVIDAINQPGATAQKGYRYKVVIDDESKTGTAGIAHIGGLVVFVDGTPAVGDVLIIEITQMKTTTANAVIIEKVGTMEVPRRAASGRAPRSREASIDGKIYKGVVDDIGRDGDGIVHKEGKVVFVEGSKTVGEEVTFIITYDGPRSSAGHLITAEEAAQLGGEIVKLEASKAPVRRSYDSPADSPVKVGQAYKGVVNEMADRGDAIVRVGGKVVFIAGAVEGEEVVFVVEKDGGRAATGRKMTAEEAAAVQPIDVSTIPAAPRQDRRSSASRSPKGASLAVGETYSGVVEDIGTKGDGIVRINGKVVFVPGTVKGQAVSIRIIEDRGSIAMGEVISAAQVPAEPPAPVVEEQAPAEEIVPVEAAPVEEPAPAEHPAATP